MAKWVPMTALFGLVCLMILPTPGVVGIVIGSVCALAIVISAIVMLLDRLADRVTVTVGRFKERRTLRRSRAVHSVSGMARKV